MFGEIVGDGHQLKGFMGLYSQLCELEQLFQLSYHQEFQVPKMEGFLKLIAGYLGGGWVFPYISLHTAYIGEDTFILGTSNVWWNSRGWSSIEGDKNAIIRIPVIKGGMTISHISTWHFCELVTFNYEIKWRHGLNHLEGLFFFERKKQETIEAVLNTWRTLPGDFTLGLF